MSGTLRARPHGGRSCAYRPKGEARCWGMHLIVSRCLVATALTASLACSGDPVSYSAPVGINLKATGEDARSGVVVDEKNVNTESGNPYGAFVGEARKQLGRDPGRIEVAQATLLLGGTSQGVTALEQVLLGRIDVQFVLDDTNNSYNVAHLENAAGTGPVAFQVDFRPESLAPTDQAKLLSGGFKVVLRSAAAPAFMGRKDASADLQVSLEFAAFE
jgi:hypothetical protein